MDKALKTAIHYLWDHQNESSHAQKAFTESLKRAGIVQADGTLNLASIADENDRWAIFRGLVNVRDSYQPSEEYLMAEGAVLQAKLAPGWR